MRRLQQLCSLANLTRSRNAMGQVATFLLLITAGVLIIALATANLGQVAVHSTRVANAADSAALRLGSSLAT